MEQGLEEDFLVAIELGATSREQLTEAQLEYVDKIKEKLIKVGILIFTRCAAACYVVSLCACEADAHC